MTLCQRKKAEIIEREICPDLLLSIPKNTIISRFMRFKGKNRFNNIYKVMQVKNRIGKGICKKSVYLI